MIILGILLLGWTISVFITGYVIDFQSINAVVRTLAPLWIIVSLYWLSIGLVRIKIIPAHNEMIKDYLFGIYKKKYVLSMPLDVSVSTTYQRGKRIDSDVYVKTPQASIKVRRFPKSNQIEPFIEEFKSLFKVISG
jgi:hypothetical protein